MKLKLNGASRVYAIYIIHRMCNDDGSWQVIDVSEAGLGEGRRVFDNHVKCAKACVGEYNMTVVEDSESAFEYRVKDSRETVRIVQKEIDINGL